MRRINNSEPVVVVVIVVVAVVVLVVAVVWVSGRTLRGAVLICRNIEENRCYLA